MQFFVADPASKLFAPSKFCAFVPAMLPGHPPPPATMTFEVYEALGERDPRFDGSVARKHLARRLAFRVVPLVGSGLEQAFGAWHEGLADHVALRNPVTLLLPPTWYRA